MAIQRGPSWENVLRAGGWETGVAAPAPLVIGGGVRETQAWCLVPFSGRASSSPPA